MHRPFASVVNTTSTECNLAQLPYACPHCPRIYDCWEESHSMQDSGYHGHSGLGFLSQAASGVVKDQLCRLRLIFVFRKKGRRRRERKRKRQRKAIMGHRPEKKTVFFGNFVRLEPSGANRSPRRRESTWHVSRIHHHRRMVRWCHTRPDNLVPALKKSPISTFEH